MFESVTGKVKTLGGGTRWNGSIDDEAATTNTHGGRKLDGISQRQKILKKLKFHYFNPIFNSSKNFYFFLSIDNVILLYTNIFF